jgi:hypothetical protein
MGHMAYLSTVSMSHDRSQHHRCLQPLELLLDGVVFKFISPAGKTTAASYSRPHNTPVASFLSRGAATFSGYSRFLERPTDEG